MSAYNDIKKYYRFCTGLSRFLKNPLSLEECRATTTEQTGIREKQFLNIIEKAVYKNPKSPYLKILQLAGYEFEDIRGLTERIGIEDTLRKLVQDGVYITFEEFKCRKKVVRGGTTFEFKESDFDNPFLSSYFNVESGGTSGPGTRTMIDFDSLSQEAVCRALALDIYGIIDAPCILWFPILPGNAGIKNLLRQAKINRPPIRWFSQVDKKIIRPSIKDRFGTGFVVHMGRLLGIRMPKPEYVDLKDAHGIAQYIADVINKYSRCSVWTYVNSAIRICTATRERNLNIKGTTFFVAGEPVTQTKLTEIRSAGADVVPYYAFVEGGIIAYGCLNPSCPDDMHILKNRIAVINHKRELEHYNNPADPLLFTSLLPESPKILLNVEIGDYGLISHHNCGCKFEDIGFLDHISNVRSFEKFTNEGMTFMVNDLINIAEEILPARYGGTSADYQFSEESGMDGMTFINLAVSLRVGPLEEGELIKTVLQELEKGKDSKRLMAEIWSQAGTIKVKRMDPIPTRRGKIFSFRSMQNKDTCIAL
jgi:hypothetical protein